MPWYWSDDVARILISEGGYTSEMLCSWTVRPVAFRRDEETVEQAAEGLVEDGEIPLAA